MMKHRVTACVATAVALAATAMTASASNLYWEGGTAALSDPNYFNFDTSATGAAPAAGDILFIGENGTANSATDLSVGKLYVGHTDTGGGADALPGPGTVNVTAGTVSTTAGANGVHGLIVGNGDSGTLNIDGTGAVTVNRLAAAGYGSDSTKSAAVNITNGGTLTVSVGNFILGDAPSGGTGIPGHVNVNGTLTVASTLTVGAQAASSFSMTGGSVTTNGVTLASSGTNAINNDSFSASGGTLTVKGSFLAGTGINNNLSVSFSGTAVASTTSNFVVADNNSTSDHATLSVADSAHLTVGNSLFLGRASSTNATLNMTGGQLDITTHLLMGTSTAATGVTVNQSGGTLTTGVNFVVNDTGTGDSTYNLSGTGAVVATGRGIVGRQKGLGTLNQTGGSAAFNGSLRVGDAQVTTPASYGTGVYNLYAGSVTASTGTAPDALAIAPAGTGTFHVFGSDASVTVTGDMNVYANTNGGTNVGTLAYTLQPGESLTEINVSGTATFQTGSVLSLDLNAVTPAQPSYDLLTATDVVDNGLTPALPAGWNYRIVTGGNGEILQAFAAVTRLAGDVNGDGFVNSGDINAFIFALSHDAAGFQAQYPTGVYGNADVNGTGHAGDTFVNAADINPFIQILSGTGEPGITAALAAVPEPTSLGLLGLGSIGLLSRRHRRRSV